MPESRFRRGDRVRLRVDPSVVGRIDADPAPYSGGWTYSVFFGSNDVRFVPESGLDSAADESTVAVLTREAFLRSLLLAKLDNPLSNFLYAYQASRTQFEPYQFKPVFKYMDAPVPGILIADEVGLGKTIEAAILYEELKARQRVNRILIVCPAGLRIKWQSELLTRFDEQFTLLRRPDILNDIRLYHETDGAQPLFGITGLETIRGRGIQDELDEHPVRYDMVIIDEAHHLRTAGRLSNRIGERLSDLTDNLVLLTATPLQTSQQDLFNLVRFIDAAQFQQLDDFLLQLTPNALLNEAIRSLRPDPPDLHAARMALERIQHVPAGNQVTHHPNYPHVVRALGSSGLTREAIVKLQREIDQMNVISSIYTRTRKRDVAGVAKRQAHVINIPITDEERVFYDAVLAHARAEARSRSTTGMIPGFIGMMRERQAASCMTATREYFEELYRGRDNLQIEDSSSEVEPEVRAAPGSRVSDPLDAVLAAARRLGNTDSKFEKFNSALRAALDESADSKVIVFSFFRRTLSYLERQLKANGYDLIQINGGIPPDQRAYLIDRFRSDPKIQVLLTSEVGAEGLDFQFCDTLFNYDLPWNPMRVEQRIGRIDRYGQKRDKVRIYSMFLEGTVEERILERLYTRIGIFEDSIGDLEPILGPLSNELTREIFTAELTPDEEAEVAARYIDQVLYRRAEERDLEARSSELLGQDALILQAIDETVKAGRYISAAELRALVTGYLQEATVNAYLTDTVGDGTATLHPDGRLTARLQDLATLERDTRPTTTEFISKVQRSARIPVTFDGETAMQSRLLELLNLRHILLRAAISHYRDMPRAQTPITDLTSHHRDDVQLTGTFTFAIFLVSLSGAQSQTRLVTVALDEQGRREPALEERLLWLIQESADDAPKRPWSSTERDALVGTMTAIAASIADQLEGEARDRNDAILAVRRVAIERTIRTKIRKRRQQIENTFDERIHRMWSAEIRNLEQDLSDRLRALEARSRVGATYSVLGGGRITFVDREPPLEDPVPPAEPSRLPAVVEGYPEPPARELPWP